MLDLADVTPADTVYDLGCGDGRIAIAAARRGARAVGVDCEPYWAEQATLNADAAGVAARVQFSAGDALALDLSPASVVCLYLVHWSTQLVAKHLISQCVPGTRVVSHSFGFEALAGVRSEDRLDADGQPRQVHLWVVPARTTR
jgi:ribosomal protein L11 methylase PrmA